MKKLIFILIGTGLGLFFGQCHPSRTDSNQGLMKKALESEKNAGLSMSFSTMHRDFFKDVEKNSYTAEEIEPLFKKMIDSGDKLCSILHRLKPFNEKVYEEFLTEFAIAQYKPKLTVNNFYSLVAGCWNFFIMNDARPYRDFRLVKGIIEQDPGSSKESKAIPIECYSVGYLQPYIMHNELGCSRLVMVDVDWRIHQAHYQLLNLYRQNKLEQPEKLNEVLATLRFGFTAYDKNIAASKPGSIYSFCYAYQEETCRNQLHQFQENFKTLKSIQFQVSALHNADYRPRMAGSISIVFLSNAVESMYTSRQEFETLLTNAVKFSKDKPVYMIYHVGGRAQFGIYAVSPSETSSDSMNSERSFQVRTICKDRYLSHTIGGREAHEYNTWFEEYSLNRAVACSTEYHRKVKK